LLKHAGPPDIGLISLLLVLEEFVFRLLQQLLPALLCCFFLQLSADKFLFRLLKYLVPTLRSFSHPIIELHVVHSHFHDKVSLFYFLNLLLGFVSDHL
jgi:hypothetical protein